MPNFGVRKIGHDSYDQCTLLRHKYGVYHLLGRNVNLDGSQIQGWCAFLIKAGMWQRLKAQNFLDQTHILYRFFSKTFSPSIPTIWEDGWPQGLL